MDQCRISCLAGGAQVGKARAAWRQSAELGLIAVRWSCGQRDQQSGCCAILEREEVFVAFVCGTNSSVMISDIRSLRDSW